MAFVEKLRAQLNRLPRLRRFELFAAFVGLIVPVASGDAPSSLSTEMKCTLVE
jgi:hypothetical protein